MKTTVVPVSQLGDDWRAAAHVPPSEEDIKDAKDAGWRAGAVDTERPSRSFYLVHPRSEIRGTFIRAYEASRRARKAYFENRS